MLENTKQAYAFHKAFELAGNEGLNLRDLADKMKEISERDFGSDYVTVPTPLTVMLRRSIEHGIVDQPAFGVPRFVLTEGGKRGLRFLERIAVFPFFEQQRLEAADA